MGVTRIAGERESECVYVEPQRLWGIGGDYGDARDELDLQSNASSIVVALPGMEADPASDARQQAARERIFGGMAEASGAMMSLATAGCRPSVTNPPHRKAL
jgi:hypothetical protein